MTHHNRLTTNTFKSPTFVRVFPFALFMAFIALEQGLCFLSEQRLLPLDEFFISWLYLPKVLCVGLLLIVYRKHYLEVRLQDLCDYRATAISLGSGVVVFILWINMDWVLGGQKPQGFNPEVFGSGALKGLMVTARVAGAVLVVPIMEELFWRSFLLRYLIDRDFLQVRIGHYSLFSFVAVSVLFGLEHHYVLAGIMAGVLFNVVYYSTRSIMQCIVSHAVANFCLALYVIRTGQWQFW